jgi:hypothetical protein
LGVNGNQLLSALGSGIVPGRGDGAEVRRIDGPGFDEILSRVMDGKPSGIGVELSKDMIPGSVDKQTIERVGQAADLAAINGISRAIVDLGGSLVRLDVHNRMIEAQIEPVDGEVIDQIDGFVSIGGGQDKINEETDAGVGGACQSGTRCAKCITGRVAFWVIGCASVLISVHDPDIPEI